MTEDLPRSERNKAQAALNTLPRATMGFYTASYRQDNKGAWLYVGLTCRVCNRLKAIGHTSRCSVANFEETLSD